MTLTPVSSVTARSPHEDGLRKAPLGSGEVSVAVRSGVLPVNHALVDAVLAIQPSPLAANFYLDASDLEGGFSTTASQRRDRLFAHLSSVVGGDLVLVGEAAGWQGARQSGVAFTSPASVGLVGSKEPSATAVHGLLSKAGLLGGALLWNAFPLHPHQIGQPRTNRTPTASELDAGLGALRLAIDGRRILCVGRKSEAQVELILGHSIPSVVDASVNSRAIRVRHPSNGGSTQFRDESAQALRIWKLL